MSKKGFGSDNHAGIHPTILQQMLLSNEGHQPSYGTDDYSFEAINLFKNHFGQSAEIHFVYNGTAANILALRVGLQRHESCLVSDVSHLNIDECGAPEFFAGKLIPVPSHHGKISIAHLKEKIIRKGDQHFSPVKMLSLTQPTELGTCYTVEEIKDICTWAKSENIFVHIDGARLSNAAHFLKTTFNKMLVETGVDIISFGGTKNGLAFGEAVVILNKDLKNDFKFIRKQSAQLPSKTRFIASQFKGYLENGLYLKIADHVHSMALLLETKLKNVTEITITQPVQSNAVFAIIPKDWVTLLRKKFFFYVWNEHTFECRIMMSWDTTPQDIIEFTEEILKLTQQTN